MAFSSEDRHHGKVAPMRAGLRIEPVTSPQPIRRPGGKKVDLAPVLVRPDSRVVKLVEWDEAAARGYTRRTLHIDLEQAPTLMVALGALLLSTKESKAAKR